MSNKPRNKKQFKHHFLPHPKHRVRATLLSNRLLTLYIFILLAGFLFIKYTPIVAPGVLGYASNINIDTLLEDTNKRRASMGLSQLKINSKLSIAAKNKAEHMFKENYWAHVSPKGIEPWKFILDANYDYLYAGENLAKNFNTSSEVVEAWYNSPSHRENMLNPKYSDVGFAIVNGTLQGYDTTLVVQMFGHPRGVAQLPSLTDSGATEQLGIEVSYVEEPVINKPVIDIRALNTTLSYVFGFFLLTLLSIDIWYSHRKGIQKFTGHTFAHILFLVVVIASVWFSLLPGAVL